jgi:hypothetical protein
MYHREHGVAHFRARYGGQKISVEVQSGRVQGSFPPRALRDVRAWAGIHVPDLLAYWERAQQGKPLEKIPPLE